MKITFDPAKRDWTIQNRKLFFEDAAHVFAGDTYDFEDDRHDYGEERCITVGWLGGRMMIVVWTPRGDARHIISMRKANDREQKGYSKQFD